MHYWTVLATVLRYEIAIYILTIIDHCSQCEARYILASICTVPTIELDIYQPVLATVVSVELDIYHAVLATVWS